MADLCFLVFSRGRIGFSKNSVFDFLKRSHFFRSTKLICRVLLKYNKDPISLTNVFEDTLVLDNFWKIFEKLKFLPKEFLEKLQGQSVENGCCKINPKGDSLGGERIESLKGGASI